MPIQPRDLSATLLAEGRYTFTVEDAADALGTSHGAALDALARLQQRREVFSPTRGLYVAIPPDLRSWGVVPGVWFIDAMMRHLDRPYYVALLTAARMHGASHHAAQVMQVMTNPAPIRNRDLERVRLRFYRSKHVRQDRTQPMTVHTGYVVVSAKETTVVDLIGYRRAAGGYNNVATIVREIGELDGSELARVASRRGLAITRRTGWFAEQFGAADDLEALRQAARLDVGEPSLLDPAAKRRGPTDKAWSVRVNTAVEPDV